MERQEKRYVEETVHRLYWEQDVNCARTMLTCLGELFSVPIEPQTMHAAIGMHGAGGFRAQCGLVEGALMFIGIYLSARGRSDANIASECYRFAQLFTAQFKTLTCKGLRPAGFTDHDPPHACERLTDEAIMFTIGFLRSTDS
jgi:hypothetical protein